MFNISKQEFLNKFSTLTYDEVKKIENGVSLEAMLVLEKLFPNETIIKWFIEMKRRSE